MTEVFGGGTATKTVTPAPPSAEELALQQEALVSAQIRNQLLREQITEQGEIFRTLEGRLEPGIAATLAEEARFGILAGEDLTGAALKVPTGPDVPSGAIIPPGPIGPVTPVDGPPAGPPSAQIGLPGAEGANVPQIGALQQRLAQLNVDVRVQRDILTEEGQPGEVDARTQRSIDAVNQQIASLQTEDDEAAQQTAIQTAVQNALAEQGTVPQDLIDRLEALLAQTPPQGDGTAAGESVRQTLFQKQLDLIEQGGRATEQDIADIKAIADTALAEGAESLSNFADRMLVDIRDVLTPARGLRPQDTPIRDVGGRVGAEATRQFGELQKSVRATQAQQAITVPLARQGFQAQLVGFQQNIAQAAREFQVGLRQQAFDNRLRLAATRTAAFGTLLGTPGVSVDFPRGSVTTTKQPLDILGGLSTIGGIIETGIGIFKT